MSVSDPSLEIKYYVIIAFIPSEIQQQRKTKNAETWPSVLNYRNS